VAIAACRLGQPDRLRRWCARLLAAGVTEQAAEARAIALAQAAIQLFFAGTYDLLPEVFRALDAARARVGRDAPLVDAWIARARATEAKFTGDVAARLELNGASVAAHERAGDVRNALVQRCNLADTYKELGLFETAADLFRRALADADRLGLPSIRANATYNLASCLGCLGRFPEAKELGAEGIRAFLRQGDRYGAAWAAIYMAVILLQAGELEAAERESRRAVDTATAANTRTFALGILGATLLAAGRGEEALAAAEHGMKLLESLGTIEEGEALLRLAHVESLRAAGQEDRAREMLGIAWRWLMERAGRIGSEELRGSFVRCVPEHARIVELARALGVAPAAP
jgi:tetratricopeptide (TPR) repeat protein